MGWFGKDRFGVMEATADGRTFRWRLPKWTSEFKPGVYDSEHGTTFSGASFHFHLVVANEGDLGVYLHYKSMPIPKYSFFFTCAAGTRSRQHTALNIPDDTERVGHWNVCRKQELVNMLAAAPGNNDELVLQLNFDDDRVSRVATNESDCKYSWRIPRFNSRYLEPFTSAIFLVDGLNYVVRIDRKRGIAAGAESGASGASAAPAFVVFLFSRRSVFPPHRISLVANGATVAATAERDDMSTQLLTLPADVVAGAVAADGSLQIDIEFRKGGNPLDGAFSLAPAAAASKSNRPATIPGCEGSSNPYVTVVTDDEI